MRKRFTLIILLLSLDTVFANDMKNNNSYEKLGFSETPTIAIGGYIDAGGAKASQNNYYNQNKITVYDQTATPTSNKINNKATDDFKLATEASLRFKIDGLNSYGFEYGAVFELNANTTQNSWNNDNNVTKSYIFGESLLGKFEIGSELGASKKMKIDASTIARGPGGIKGKYLDFINLPSSSTSNSPLFILIPDLPTSHGGYAIGFNNLFYLCDINGNGLIDSGDESTCYSDNSSENFELDFQRTENASKISYYTPEIFGYQFGISYTPDTGDKGTSGHLSSKLDQADLENILEYGVTFKQTFSNVNLALSATAEMGKSQTKSLNSITNKYERARENLNAYQFGGSISYFGFTFVGSIGNWGNSLNYKYNLDGITKPEKNNGSYNTAGIAYEFGPINASGTYFTSEFQKNDFTAYSLDLDYKAGKGFMPYIEYTQFEFKPNKTNYPITRKNSGNIILAGFLLNF